MTSTKGLSRSLSIVLFLLSCSQLTMAEPRLYQAALHEAQWTVHASIFSCSLSQSIPNYGEVQFSQRAGESLQFRLQPYAGLMSRDGLLMQSAAPPWNSQKAGRDIDSIDVGVNNSGELTLNAVTARLLMAEMLRGMVPTFKGVAGYNSQQVVEVALSPMRFHSAYTLYQQCSAELLPVNFDQVQRSTIFWQSTAKGLDAASREMLDNIVLFSKADASIRAFEVDSFTDTVGERRDNLLVSEERAFVVTNYLISKGIDPEKIATRAHGERQEYLIVNPEKSAADRARNRRVNIVLLRD